MIDRGAGGREADEVGAAGHHRERERERDRGDLDDRARPPCQPYRPHTENGEPRLAW